MLRETLIKIWKDAIRKEYMQGMFCSERNLQAELYHQMKKSKKMKGFQFWIEPTLSFENPEVELKYVKPDILITKNKKVVCIIELKYKPHMDVVFQDDLAKMEKFESLAGKDILRLLTNPYSGDYEEKAAFEISKNVLCVFGVIAKDYAWAIRPDKWSEMKQLIKPKNLLHLMGIVFIDGRTPVFKAE